MHTNFIETFLLSKDIYLKFKRLFRNVGQRFTANLQYCRRLRDQVTTQPKDVFRDGHPSLKPALYMLLTLFPPIINQFGYSFHSLGHARWGKMLHIGRLRDFHPATCHLQLFS